MKGCESRALEESEAKKLAVEPEEHRQRLLDGKV